MKRSECWRSIREKAGLDSGESLAKLAASETTCGARFMVPIPRVAPGARENVCIDQFEFPDIPCEYPVTWVTPSEASELCQALGKRLCDAHEWEGACAGALRPAEQEYAFGQPRRIDEQPAQRQPRDRAGPTARPRTTPSAPPAARARRAARPAAGSAAARTPTRPARFPECRSPLGVYDQHGNVAEHMNCCRRRRRSSGHAAASARPR